MIKITEKEACCGCAACQQICPKKCISMSADEQGFLYPVVQVESCIDCHLCEKVCPVINQNEAKEGPLFCYLAKTKDENTRAQSSSGGIFSEIANYILSKGGVVFGVRFDENWQTVYDFAESKETLAAFRGSKYVQAIPSIAYLQVQKYLNEGRKVLFTGTPCHVSGLNHFLRKTYVNLYTMDVVCHSITSPKVWTQYLSEIEDEYELKIYNISFRDKSKGWTNYSLRIDLKGLGERKKTIVETHFENAYMRGMADDLYTRPSCAECPARNYKSCSDITIADAWDINKYHPHINDEKGISHVLINTEKGIELFQTIAPMLDSFLIDYVEVEPYSMHAPLTRSCKPSPYRNAFYERLKKEKNVSGLSNFFHYKYLLKKRIHRSIIFRIIRKISKLFHHDSF